MSSNMMLYHTINVPAYSTPYKEYAFNGLGYLQATAEVSWDFDAEAYVHERVHRATGRTHYHFFEDLEDFAVWHYKLCGVPAPEGPLTEEVYMKVPLPSESAVLETPYQVFPGTYTPEQIEVDLIATSSGPVRNVRAYSVPSLRERDILASCSGR